MTSSTPQRRRCRATAKRTQARCHGWAIVGGAVCWRHGGAAPQTRAKADARVAAAEAAAAGDYVPRDPDQALLAAAAQADRIAQALAARVQEGARPDPVDLYELGSWLDRTGRLCRSVVELRLDERRTRLAERQGELLAGAVRAILDRLDLDARQRALVGEVVPAELRRVAAIEGVA
jgi:hypothetical protein